MMFDQIAKFVAIQTRINKLLLLSSPSREEAIDELEEDLDRIYSYYRMREEERRQP